MHGDLGHVARRSRAGLTTCSTGSINSAFLVVVAGMISIPLSIAIGAYAALRRDGLFDTTARS